MIEVIDCGLSDSFHNKTNLTGSKAAFGNSFAPSQVTPGALVQHITSGKAWTQGYFNGHSRRKQQFVSAQTLALDLDDKISVDEALAQPLIRDHALLVHPSPSSSPEHPKTRVIFLLEAPVTDRQQWEAHQRNLIAHFAVLRPDPACKDAARLFYGSDQPGAHVNLSARLPLEMIPEKQRDNDTPPAPIADTAHRAPTAPTVQGTTWGDNHLSEDLVRDVEIALGVHQAAVNSEGFTRLPIACPVKHHEHDHQQPAAYWHPGIRALTCFKCSETYNTHQVAAALGIDVRPYYYQPTAWERMKNTSVPHHTERPHTSPVQLPPFHADKVVNLPYISALDPDVLLSARGVIVKSPIGTGKTQAAAQVIRRLGQLIQPRNRALRVLALTHRQSLADDLATRLADSGHIFECYKGLEAADLRRISRLVICYDSLWKLAEMNKPLPRYDLILIDEVEQFHQHLGGDTMRGGAPERAYNILRQLVMQTPHFIGLDAHATDVSVQWLKGVLAQSTPPPHPTTGTHSRKHSDAPLPIHHHPAHATPRGLNTVLTIENVYRPPQGKGTLTLHQSGDTALRRAVKLVALDEGTVAIATNTRTMAKTLHRVFSQQVGEKAVRVIHGGNSNDRDTQQFIRHINDEIGKYRVLIYSPSLGTGVDITAPVRAVVGIFTRQPIAPADMQQMMGRCRQTQERHAWVEGTEGRLETDWWRIFQRHEQNALKTGLHCHFDRMGILAVTDIQRSMLRLLSLLEAQRNRAMNAPLLYFAALARDQGYALRFVEGSDKAMRKKVKAAVEALKAAEKELALVADPVTYEELERHQISGTVTPEILAGHERFKIEDCVGQEITETIYDDLHTSSQRENLRRFSDLYEKEEDLWAEDQAEAQQRVLLAKRKHRAKRRQLVLGAIQTVWAGAAGINALMQRMIHDRLTEAEVEARILPYFEAHRQEIITYLGWRPDQSTQGTALLRWLLGKIGLTLLSEQKMVNRERFRLYFVPAARLEKLHRYARSRRAHLEEKRQTAATARYSKRVYNKHTA